MQLRVGSSAAIGLVCCSAALVLVACTVENPLYHPGGVDGGVDLAQAKTDGAIDLNPPQVSDLGQPPTCTPSARGCNATGSGACGMNNVFVPDRTCPNASVCQTGYCTPPPPQAGKIGTSCSVGDQGSESLCFSAQSASNSCQPFIVPGGGALALKWVCDVAVGAGVPGTACTTGSQCRTGFCGSNGTCFRGCVTEAECPTSGTQKFICSVVSIFVEGHVVMARSCIH